MKQILIAIVSLALGAGGMYIYTQKQEAPVMDMSHTMNMSGAMDAMNGDLLGKTGDTLDKAFLDGMIVHHQGAVKMSEVVSKTSKHPELRQLATDIIAAQNKEIEMMKKWREAWYK